MARFKLVKIGTVNGRSVVRVQKVPFKIKLNTLLIALACAILVWLYVKGTGMKHHQPPPENPPAETGASEICASHPWEAALDAAAADTALQGV